MFEDAQKSDSAYSECAGNSSDAPERRQYTIKGIETDAIELVRAAAGKEGMKIGAWISSRMKEAASRSLGSTVAAQASSPLASSAAPIQADSEILNDTLLSAIRNFDKRLMEIEAELHQITKGQRTIMAKMLERA